MWGDNRVIISEKQAQLMLQVLADSLGMVNGFAIDKSSRIELYKDILRQQDSTPKELEPNAPYAEKEERILHEAAKNHGLAKACGAKFR
jgi:hypothetical protein